MTDDKITFYIVGMPEKAYSKLIISKFKDVIYRLEKAYSEIEEARLTIKQTRTGGKNQNYQVSAVIITPNKRHVYTQSGWDLSNVCEQLGQRLLRTLSKRRKNRSKPSIRKIRERIF